MFPLWSSLTTKPENSLWTRVAKTKQHSTTEVAYLRISSWSILEPLWGTDWKTEISDQTHKNETFCCSTQSNHCYIIHRMPSIICFLQKTHSAWCETLNLAASQKALGTDHQFCSQSWFFILNYPYVTLCLCVRVKFCVIITQIQRHKKFLAACC